MRKSILLVATIMTLGAGADAADEFVAAELLVGFQPGARGAVADGVRNGLGASKIKAWPEIQAEHWHLPSGLGVAQAIQALSANPNVLYAEPNYVVHASETPNDARIAELWGMHNIGQTGGTVDVDIDALEAWQLLPGIAPVVVGVIDSGIDYNHEDLADRIWENPDEIPGNGIDDDSNGHVDDVRGWDFVNDDKDPMDDNGHGTHVSGTIAAVGDNGLGVVGVAGFNTNVKLMPLKFLAASGWGSTADAVSCINYAASFKDALGNKIVRLTSNSWGGGGKSKTLENAIKNCNAIFVASAGNDGTNTVSYPAGYAQPNLIAVAATDSTDTLASFSNFGYWVHLAAPGVDVLSSTPGNSYGLKSGTSMATPHVSGVAALLLSQYPAWTVADIRAQILDTVDVLPGLMGKVTTSGRLNARQALGAPELPPDTTAPAAVTDLAASPVSATSVTLTWTAPGDDASTGMAYICDIRYSINPINNDADFAVAGQTQGEPGPKSVGEAETFTIAGLADNRIYYFALKTIDEVGNTSQLSNLASAATPLADWNYLRLGGGQDMGEHMSSGVSSLGVWAVAWDDTGAGVLNCAIHLAGTGYYNVATVMNGGVGCSLAYSPDETGISISHVYGTQLYFVNRSTNSGSTWTSAQIEAKDVYPHETSLAYAGANPVISYYKTARRATGLYVAQRAGSIWSTRQVDPGAYAVYNQLAVDSVGNPAIAYSADANKDGIVDTLKFARFDGAAWTTSVVETGGAFGTIACDPATGQPAIAHWNNATGELRFLRSNGSGWSSAEIVETAPSITGCSLTFQADGTAYLAYGSTHMRLAIRDLSGSWTFREIDTTTTGSLRNSLRGRPGMTPGTVAYRGPTDGFYSTTARFALRKTPY